MKIRRLKVDGFGNLKGDFIFSSDRCNLILEPNESGKSTLAAAVTAALFGFPRERASKERRFTMKEQYRPWSGGRYAIELELECRSRSYSVLRDFDLDTVTVLDGQTLREITTEFSRTKDHLGFGEALTGLTREDFTRCCFVGQQEIESLREATGLTHALQRIASSQHGDVVAGEALEALSRAVDHDYAGLLLGRGKVDTEIKRLDKEIDDLRAQIEGITGRRRDSEGKILRLEQATDREGQVEGSIARVDYLCLLAGFQEVETALRQCAREREEFDGYRAEVGALGAFASFPAERLGELRELKGKLESLTERRAAFDRRLLEEVGTPLERASAAIADLASYGSLSDQDAATVSERSAVLSELWSLRRLKRRALRQEERRLRAAGVVPEHIAELAARLSGLSEQDRAFLATYRESLLELKAALSDAERERDKLAHAEGESPSLIPRAVARRAEGLSLGACFLGIVTTVLLFFTMQTRVPLVFTILLAAGGFIWWLRLLEKRPVHGAEEFGSSLQRIRTEIWAREKQQAALQERLLNIASRVGSRKPDAMVEEFRELEGLRDKAAPVTTLAASVQEVQDRYARAASDLRVLMNRANRSPRAGLVTPRAVRRFRDDLARYVEGRQKLTSLQGALEAGTKELAAMALEIESLRVSASSLLSAALGPLGSNEAGEDLAASLTRFEHQATKKERFDRLTHEILPAAERRGGEALDKRLAALTRDREVLSRQIAQELKKCPALEALKPEKSAREYSEERRQLLEESRRTQRERLALSEELGDVLKEYRRDYPTRREMLARLEAARARAAAFREAVEVARGVLSAISREAYAEWAEVLNDKTSEILRRLNPGYEDVRFDSDLSFSLRDVRTGRRLDQGGVDAQLSAGARDQIYLAVRMAASEYLSAAGTRLPLILDDPFAMFDDDRFDRGMEFLLESLARRHQIILLSCHAARHRRWQETAPEALADRVRILDLTPLSA